MSARLPAAGLAEGLDGLIEPRKIEGDGHRTVRVGREAHGEFLPAKQLLDERNGLAAAPEAKRAVVVGVAHGNRLGRCVIDAVSHIACVGVRSRCHETLSSEEDSGDIFFASKMHDYLEFFETAARCLFCVGVHEYIRCIVEWGSKYLSTPALDEGLFFCSDGGASEKRCDDHQSKHRNISINSAVATYCARTIDAQFVNTVAA